MNEEEYGDLFRNASGYFDPTAGEALSHIIQEEKLALERKRRKASQRYDPRAELGALAERLLKRPLVYMVSRYAGDVEANTAAAKRFCQDVLERGCIPVASHLMYPQFLDDREPDDRLVGTCAGFALLKRCDEVWVYADGKELSSGMKQEINYARKIGKKVVSMTLES